MNLTRTFSILTAALVPTTMALAQSTIADWTFETSQPATAGPFAAEVGSGSALGSHAGAATYSSPSGNGSAHSFSANTWAVNDYWQFQTSTLGYQNVSVSYDQTSSSTGPGLYDFSYSTDGVNFSAFASGYPVLVNGTPHATWNTTTSSSFYTFSYDLSSIIALNNASAIYLRITDVSTTSAGGGTVAAAGADRVDNFKIMASLIPEPQSLMLLTLGGMLWFIRRR
jgi:hypothetical protein